MPNMTKLVNNGVAPIPPKVFTGKFILAIDLKKNSNKTMDI